VKYCGSSRAAFASFSFCRLFATRQRVFKETWHHSRIYSEAVKMACRVTQPFR
jgi:hypothetical protein